MAHPFRFSWLVLLTILAGAPRLATPAGPPSPAIPAKSLTRSERQQLDRLALRQPMETIEQEKVNRAGNVTAWLLSQVSLPPEEERKRADRWHAELARRERLLDAPPAVRRILARLTAELPPHLKPSAFTSTLTVVERPAHAAFSPGGGRVYLTRPLMRALLADHECGEAALAFILAREVAHTALLHCRRGWQRLQIEDDVRKGVQSSLHAGPLRAALETGVQGAGGLALFLYSRDQEYEADTFAMHLCRNAGYPVDHALDGMRTLVLLRHPAALRSNDYRPAEAMQPSTLAYYLSPSADPLVRLRRLIMERDGLVEGDGLGLFRFDRATGALSACKPRSVTARDRPIIFVHGMHPAKDAFRAFLLSFGEQKELAGRTLLVFRYPGNGSLARSGRFLFTRVQQTLAAPSSAVFVCHSAGGLVFRYYAERLGGAFDRAVLLGAPHAGSRLAELKFLVDLAHFAHDLTGGLSSAIARNLPEGRGEMTLDLHPDSLFLRHLGRAPLLAKRYHVIYGEYLGGLNAFTLRCAFLAARSFLEKNFPGTKSSGILRTLRLPEEVVNGDLVVSRRSAALPGAGRTTGLRVGHLALTSDPRVMREVLASILHGGGDGEMGRAAKIGDFPESP